MRQPGQMEKLAIVMGGGAGIEASEAAGQQEFVESAEFPKDLRPWRRYDASASDEAREKLEALGFVFGEDVDELFQKVTLPEGWKFKALDHSMWNALIDANGQERASIFYKAAFYDRRAHASFYEGALEAEYTYVKPDLGG